MIKLYNNDPNLTIVLPVNCNANCNFCFWKRRDFEKGYMDNLKTNIKKLPATYFNQVSISGGEPTFIDPIVLKDLLEFLRPRFKKIVLNTNGFELLELLELGFVRDNIDYINLSRHSIDDNENYKIFKSNTVPSTEEIILINKIKPVRLNCIFDDDLNYSEWIHYAKNTDSEGIAFRRLASNGVEKKSTLEMRLDGDCKIENLYKSKCIVCYSANYRVGKLNIVVRYSVEETKQHMRNNTIYEIISDGAGDLHHTWNNNKTTKITDFNFKVKYNLLERLLTKLYKFLYREEI